MIGNVGGEDNAVESKDKSLDKQWPAGHVQQQLHSAVCSAALSFSSSSSYSTWPFFALTHNMHFLFKLQMNVKGLLIITPKSSDLLPTLCDL